MGSTTVQELLRQIPAVDQLLLRPRLADWVKRTSRGFVVSGIQSFLNEIRKDLKSVDAASGRVPADDELVFMIEDHLRNRLVPALRPVINATGVVLHTNLGRAPMSEGAREALAEMAGSYANLEYDLESGGRWQRDKLIEPALREVIGCEAATIVNNNAAAVFLILDTLARGKEVVVSRGELIEIGGSFRIPDILVRSGAVLREVGTTNKTRVEDYAAAVTPDTALILRVHPSNYRILGFTHRPELGELLELARRFEIPLVEDLGSGCLLDLSPYGIREEPLVQESIAAGVDLVCFSGDKLLGGAQAGIIAGSRKFVEAIRKNPLMRTYRVEKLIYAALEATLESYRTGRAIQDVPVLRMLALTHEEIRKRSQRFSRRLRARMTDKTRVTIKDGRSVMGGGSCPEASLTTSLIAIESEGITPNSMESRLRAQSPPIIARLEEDKVLIDLRTVFPTQENALLTGILKALE